MSYIRVGSWFNLWEVTAVERNIWKLFAEPSLIIFGLLFANGSWLLR